MIESFPYLSVVVTARNDDHGGNLLQRMQLFITNFIEQCQRYLFKTELVLVEWNPPSDRPKLAQAISWPTQTDPCRVRIIEVPPHIHRRFKYSDQLPLFQMIGKNIGIRRAMGKFVLVTNIDILFSDELARYLATNSLKPGLMYRVDRYDVSSDIPPDTTYEARLTYCRENVIRINLREGTKNLHSGHFHLIHPRLTPITWTYEKAQDLKWLPVKRWSRLHTNASGDFTLMSRDNWFTLRGYPEFEMYSFHLDSVLCHAAHHNGIREYTLSSPLQIYHLEHAQGSGWTPEGHDKLNDRLKAVKIPQLDHDQLVIWAIQMRREGRAIIFNSENWGLADDELLETYL